jgi:hypothetical protein
MIAARWYGRAEARPSTTSGRLSVIRHAFAARVQQKRRRGHPHRESMNEPRGVGDRVRGSRIFMRKRKPPVAALDEVTIRREGADAIIDFHDSTIATTHFRIGPAVHRMTDQQILDRFNEVVADERRATGRHVAIEVPPGCPQIRYFPAADQWVPRGGVLRCVVDDSGPDGEAVIHIDDQVLSLSAFGRLLCTYSGWGVRIVFVPEEALTSPPRIEVCEPSD